jgi:hypothetical protein
MSHTEGSGMQRPEPRHVRDVQRQRLYDAENHVSEGRVWDSLAAAQPYVDGLPASPWWQMHFPSVRSLVPFDPGGRYALAHKGVHGGAIQLPRWARTELTRMHELAHLASPPAAVGRGPAFAGIARLRGRHGLGERVAAQLARHFSASRVRVQAFEVPRHHWSVPRRRGVARQDRAARMHPAPTTKWP